LSLQSIYVSHNTCLSVLNLKPYFLLPSTIFFPYL
jgi:hypothetical protein